MNIYREVVRLDETNLWNQTFQFIQLDTRKIIDRKTIKVAKLPQNCLLNRYRDVLPYDDSRVRLKSNDGDYINANYVEVKEVNKKYILTQGPLANTCKDFWRMVWENNSKVIIMLNRIIEKNTVKCHPYWPMGEGEKLELGDFEIRGKGSQNYDGYIIRTFNLTNLTNSKARTIVQYQYTQWPDFGVPNNPESFIEFLFKIGKENILNPDSPPVVHCSAGIGRSGTFCLVDVAIAKAQKDESPDLVKPRDLLLTIREHRVGLVQTVEQYRFAHIAIITGYSRLFPDLFENHIQQDREQDIPPPLPPRLTKNVVPPSKPNQNNIHELIESEEDESSDEEEVIYLSDLGESEDSQAELDKVVPVTKIQRTENITLSSETKAGENIELRKRKQEKLSENKELPEKIKENIRENEDYKEIKKYALYFGVAAVLVFSVKYVVSQLEWR